MNLLSFILVGLLVNLAAGILLLGAGNALTRWSAGRPTRLFLLAAGILVLAAGFLLLERLIPAITIAPLRIVPRIEARTLPVVPAFGIACLVVYTVILRSVQVPDDRTGAVLFQRVFPLLRVVITSIFAVGIARHAYFWHEAERQASDLRLTDGLFVAAYLLGILLFGYLSLRSTESSRGRPVLQACAIAVALATLTVAISL